MIRPSETPVIHDQPACLYEGAVMHARLSDAHHRFQYRVVSLLIDLDRLDEANQLSPWFGINRLAPVSFHERDHGAGFKSSLRAHVDHLLREAGLSKPASKVSLLCYPRVLGYVFNPLSVYFAFDDDGAIMALIYEVRNTFGDMHTYVIPVSAEHASPASIRQGCAKAFYVSPFMGMAQRYHFRIRPPGNSIRIRILETDQNGPSLSACFSGEAVPLNTQSVGRLFLKKPWASFKVTLGIHWEALRLWLKGADFHSRAHKWTGYSIIVGPDADPSILRANSLSKQRATLKPLTVSLPTGSA